MVSLDYHSRTLVHFLFKCDLYWLKPLYQDLGVLTRFVITGTQGQKKGTTGTSWVPLKMCQETYIFSILVRVDLHSKKN
jgi:hypothetical protein